MTGNYHFPSSVSPENWSSRKLTQAHQASETGLNWLTRSTVITEDSNMIKNLASEKKHKSLPLLFHSAKTSSSEKRERKQYVE